MENSGIARRRTWSADIYVGMGFTDDMEPIHAGGEWKRSIARRVRRGKKNRSKKHEEGL